jgi:hypothetical protein
VNKNGFSSFVVIVLIALMTLAAIYYFKSKNNNVIISIPSPSPISTLGPTNFPVKKLKSTDTTFPHELLPGFNINIPAEWKLSFKQFNEPANNQFTSIYFPSCHERCMGVKIMKDNVGLELSFDVAFDSNAYECSINTSSTPLSNGWFKILKDNKYFYTKGVTKSDSKDSVCIQGSGSFLIQSSPVEDTEGPGTKAPILLEHPRVLGNPTKEQLKEIDSIVTSINGLVD